MYSENSFENSKSKLELGVADKELLSALKDGLLAEDRGDYFISTLPKLPPAERESVRLSVLSDYQSALEKYTQLGDRSKIVSLEEKIESVKNMTI